MEQDPASKDVNVKKLNGIEFREGSRLEARDHLGDKWWDAKIVEVDQEGCEVLVHFQGWNGRHDEWIKMDSPRLQPLHRRSRRLSTGPLVDTIPGPGPSSTVSPSQSSSHTGPNLYTQGEEVLALWKQNRKFPATILRIQDDGGYLVRFYDGYEKIVRGQCIRRIGKQDADFVKQCKQQIVANGDKDLDDSVVRKDDLDSDLVDADPPPTKLRRERKSKFNVREILNLAPAKKPSTVNSPKINSSEVQEAPKNGVEPKRNGKGFSDPSGDLDLNDSLDSKSEQSVSETGSEGTPSEKENFNCDMVGKYKSKSKESPNKMGQELTVKRERKRKRFADEEPEVQNNKKVAKKSSLSTISPVPKTKNSTKSTRVPHKTDITNTTPVLSQSLNTKSPNNAVMTDIPKKKKKENKTENNDKKCVKSSVTPVNNSRKSTVNKNNSSEKSSDKSFSYLSFDFNLPPDQLIGNLVEGVNIPGSNKPVFIKAPKLPSGWIKKVVLRGVNNLKWEVIIENNLGKSFKSRTELLRYFDEQKFEVNLDVFDFSLDTPLKKIRQIWRGSLNKSESKTLIPNGVKDDSDVNGSSVESRLPVPENIISKSSPVKESRRTSKVSTNSSKFHEKLKIETNNVSSSEPSVSSSSSSPVPPLTSPSSSSTVQTPSSSVTISPSLGKTSVNSAVIIKGNVSETGQGVRCPLKECNKLFRNDKLLQMHVKHYHPEKAVVGSPTVTELAAHRSLKDVIETSTVAAPEVFPPTPTTPDRLEESSVEEEKSFKTPEDVVMQESEAEHPDPPPAKVEDVKTESVSDNDMSKDETDGIEDDRIQDTPKLSKSRPRRLRADSLVSVSSDTVFTPPGSPGPTSASMSPTYKMSKKRAQQLRSTPSTPPDDMKDGTETMSEGEVVHCACQHTEGDGMMVQCESCLTWQHGSCLGIDNADQVPEKYVCSVCIAPPLARQSLLYNLDMDWMREGKLTSVESSTDQASETELRILSDTMTELVNLSTVLHSLQVKLSVARHKTNPKVFMWSNVWDDNALGVSHDPAPNVSDDNDNTFETVTCEDSVDEVRNNLQLVKKELENHISECGETDQVTTNGDLENDKHLEAKTEPSVEETVDKPLNAEELKSETILTNGDHNNVNGEENDKLHEETSNEIDQKSEKVNQLDKNVATPKVEDLKPSKDSKQASEIISTESHNNFSSQLADYFSSDGFDIQTLLPSVSEMQRMLPDVIKDISGSLTSSPAFIQSPHTQAPPPNIIPEPKRLDREECRQNLVEHIELLQKHVEDRLEVVEAEIELIEKKRRDAPGAWNGLIMSGKLQSVKSAKIVNSSLPDRV